MKKFFEELSRCLREGGVESSNVEDKVTLCFAEKENPEVAVLVKQALLSAYAMLQK